MRNERPVYPAGWWRIAQSSIWRHSRGGDCNVDRPGIHPLLGHNISARIINRCMWYNFIPTINSSYIIHDWWNKTFDCSLIWIQYYWNLQVNVNAILRSRHWPCHLRDNELLNWNSLFIFVTCLSLALYATYLQISKKWVLIISIDTNFGKHRKVRHVAVSRAHILDGI